MTRSQTLSALRQNPKISVLIIGGGINGIATFRDLALQGIDVLLVEKHDFCSGTSATSSHMVHGGIRYLENGEFRLVREAVQERNRLLENAPHYVKPLPTVIPIFTWFSGMFNAPLKFMRWRDKPAERGAFVIKAGLTMYDAYTRAQDIVPRHRFGLRQASLKRFPNLNPEIYCTATYYDAAMPTPERLSLELLLDAETASAQADALNYMQAAGVEDNGVILHDLVTNERLTIHPQIVINAAGPWIDMANQSLGQTTRFIGGTKGSHLVLDHPELHAAISGSEFFFENDDGRIVLIYPLLDKVLVGTSDIHADNPDEVYCTEDEIDYFLSMVAKVFPTIKVDRSQIVFRFAGIRPLPSSDATTTGQISRDHSIRIIEPNTSFSVPIFSLVGGKWTTFRAFSEQATDLILKRLGRRRQQRTTQIPIGGGRNYPRSAADQLQWLSNLQAQTNLPLERLKILFERYGTYAEVVARFIVLNTDEALKHHPYYSRREIAFLWEQEKIIHLEDLVLRRTLLGMLGELSLELLQELSLIGQSVSGWSEAERQAEVKYTLDLLAKRHGVTL